MTVFKKTKDEFLQKSREAKFIARDFTFDAGAVEKGRKDLETAQREERELYVSSQPYIRAPQLSAKTHVDELQPVFPPHSRIFSG